MTRATIYPTGGRISSATVFAARSKAARNLNCEHYLHLEWLASLLKDGVELVVCISQDA